MKIRADTWRYFCVFRGSVCATFLHKNIKFCALLRRLREKNMFLCSFVKNICRAKFCVILCVQLFFDTRQRT